MLYVCELVKVRVCVFKPCFLLNPRERKVYSRMPPFLPFIDTIVLECRYYKCTNICI